MSKVEQLRKVLMNTCKGEDIIDNKECIGAFKDAIEKVFPDNSWWEVVDCENFNSLFSGKKLEQVVDEICKSVKDEFKESIAKTNDKKLVEGTSNFMSLGNFPLLVFYTYDEVYAMMKYDSEAPSEDDFDDYNDYLDALDDFEQKYWDNLNATALDEDEVSRLEERIKDFNYDTERIADDLYDSDNDDDYYSLKEIKVTIEPGYYAASQLYVKDEVEFKYLSDEVKQEQLDRFNKFFKEVKKEFGLTQLGVSYRFSNGETGYHEVKDEELNLKETRGKGFVCSYKGYNIIDAGDTFVVTNKNGKTVHSTKNGISVIKSYIDDCVEKNIEVGSEKPLKEDKEVVVDGYGKTLKVGDKIISIDANCNVELGTIESFGEKIDDNTMVHYTVEDRYGVSGLLNKFVFKVTNKFAYVYGYKDSKKEPKFVSSENKVWEAYDSFSNWSSDMYGQGGEKVFVGIDCTNGHIIQREVSESLKEDKEETHFEIYDKEVKDLNATDEEIAKVIKVADDYEAKAQRHYITYEQMDEVAKAMGLESMSDKELRRSWDLYYSVLSREAFRDGNMDNYHKYSDAASAFAEVINREARKRKEAGNYDPDKNESLKEDLPTIEDMFKSVGVKNVFDKDGFLTNSAYKNYKKVVNKYFNGDYDALDKLCSDEKCFKESLLTEKRWSYTLKAGSSLRDAINNEDAEGIRQGLLDCYKELFDNDLIDEYDYEDWTEEVEDAEFIDENDDINEDEIDFQLSELYDLCDNINVFIALEESLKESDNSITYKKGWDIVTNKDEDNDNVYDVIHNGVKEYSSDDKGKCVDYINKYSESLKESCDGWIALYNGKKLEIRKGEADSLYGAKQLAIKKLNVPKSKVGELAIACAYDDDNEDATTSQVQFESLKESEDDEIISVLGIEQDKNNPFFKDKENLVKQYKELKNKFKDEKDIEIYLKGDDAYWKDFANKVDSSDNLDVVKRNK